MSFRICLLLRLLCPLFLLSPAHAGLNDGVIWGSWNREYNGTTNGSLVIYKYHVDTNSTVVRVHLHSRNATIARPLLAVFREPRNVLSLQLPIAMQSYNYSMTARTLCPFDNETHDAVLSVEMSSAHVVDYALNVSVVEHFHLELHEPQQIVASPSEPVFVQFNIPEHLDSVMVTVQSNDDICMTLSLQPVGCPVFDLESNVITTGLHQTMTQSGSIAVVKSGLMTNGFYILFVVKPDDRDCKEIDITHQSEPQGQRRKNMTVVVSALPTDKKYLFPIVGTLLAVALIFLTSICFILTMGHYERRNWEEEGMAAVRTLQEAAPLISTGKASKSYGALSVVENLVPGSDLMEENNALVEADQSGPSASSASRTAAPVPHEQAPDAGDRIDEDIAEYDTLEDALLDKDVVRQKRHLTVADLSLKTWKERENKYSRYIWGLLTISMFYGLPVVQLVFTWQNTVRLSGDMDLCWYNFHCARPFLGIFAFNSIFSNVGYVALGLLLLILVKERALRHRSILQRLPPDMHVKFGIPMHNGLMYAIGTSIMMEGVLSASYHVCPSSANYQFDTAFMYMIGALGILKIYQMRHPDINPNAHVSFAVMALFIFIAMCGVYFSDLPFWIAFSALYAVIMFYVSFEFYFKGRWRCNICDVFRSIRYSLIATKSCQCLIPQFKGRFLFLVLGNGINLAYVVYGLLNRPKDFPSYLLFPFVANLFLYIIYYIFMKLLHRESICRRAIGFLILAFICWGASIWFFRHSVANWSVTAAQSRVENRPCILFDFYDNHDVWHFLSALGLFFSFAILICIDDDLQWVRRNEIAVF